MTQRGDSQLAVERALPSVAPLDSDSSCDGTVDNNLDNVHDKTLRGQLELQPTQLITDSTAVTDQAFRNSGRESNTGHSARNLRGETNLNSNIRIIVKPTQNINCSSGIFNSVDGKQNNILEKAFDDSTGPLPSGVPHTVSQSTEDQRHGIQQNDSQTTIGPFRRNLGSDPDYAHQSNLAIVLGFILLLVLEFLVVIVKLAGVSPKC